MEQARHTIRTVLAEASAPAVMWSGGKDSQLLLSLVREVKNVPVIWFRNRVNETFQKRMIMEWGLDAWSWEPSDVYVLPNKDELTLVREQSFGTQNFPVVTDIETGHKCIGEFLSERTPKLFPHFDKILIGYKDTDYHWTFGGSGFCPEDGWQLGKAQMYAPLRHLTDDDVWGAIRELDVPYDTNRYDEGGVDPDTIQACTRCLQGKGKVFCPREKRFIDQVEWNPELNLQLFRARFGFKEAA